MPRKKQPEPTLRERLCALILEKIEAPASYGNDVDAAYDLVAALVRDAVYDAYVQGGCDADDVTQRPEFKSIDAYMAHVGI